MLKGIIFDMDGVLINTEPLHYEIWKETFRRRGVDIEYDRYKDCIGSTAAYLMELIYKNYGADFRQDTTIRQEMMALKDETIEREGFPRIKGVPQMLRRLRGAGFSMAVASSSPQRYIEKAMKAMDVEDCFDLLFSGEKVENPKPAPDVFLAAAAGIGLKPDECLVVEDSTNGCRAAKAAGMVCLGYQNPDSGHQHLEIADDIFNDYEIVDEAFLQKIYEAGRQNVK